MSCMEFREDAAHLEVCPDCAALAREARLLSRARAPSAPPALWARIARELPARTRLRGWIKAAAAAAFLAVVGWGTFGWKPEPKRTLEITVVEATSGTFEAAVPTYGEAEEFALVETHRR